MVIHSFWLDESKCGFRTNPETAVQGENTPAVGHMGSNELAFLLWTLTVVLMKLVEVLGNRSSMQNFEISEVGPFFQSWSSKTAD